MRPILPTGALSKLPLMPTVSDAIDSLSGLAAGAAGWDPVGLQVGDPAASVRSVAVCHEATDAVIDAALAEGTDFLVAYHPLLFSPTTRLVAGAGAPGRAHRLIAAGVSLFVVHTGWDTTEGGAADALAGALRLGDVEPFGADDGAASFKLVTFLPEPHVPAVMAALAGAGAGTIGEYTSCGFVTAGTGTFVPAADATPFVGERAEHNAVPEARVEMIVPAPRREPIIRALLAAHPYEEPAFDLVTLQPASVFVGRVGTIETTTLGGLEETCRAVLGFHAVRRAGPASMPVSRVAVVPGSGSGMLGSARAAGADVLVTGDVGHHRAVEALEAGVGILDVGHAPSEGPGMVALVAAVSDLLEVPVTDLTGVGTNPWGIA